MADPLNPRRRRPSTVVIAVVIAIIAGITAALYFYWRDKGGDGTASAQTSSKGKGKKGGFDPNRPQPVIAEPARKGDINLYLSGLGTVVPLKTVTVRSRVDGELMRVNFNEGQMVKAGDVLAEIDPRPYQVMLQQAEGQLAKDEALLQNARIDLERYTTLFKQDSIAKQQVDTQASLVRQYEGTIKTDQSSVENAKLQLTYARITSPITGRLGLRQVDPGNIVHAGDAGGLVVITQLQPVSVVFTIPQDQLAPVMKRRDEKLPVEAWDRDNRNKVASGTLITVDNVVDPQTGTVKLKAEFPNQDNALFPQQFVNARMLIDTHHDVTTIPIAALQKGSQGNFVYVVKDDSTVTARTVQLGPQEGNRAEVTGGVQPGEVVVTDGLDRLREGMKVEASAQRAPLPVQQPAQKKGGRKKAQ
ncbi:MAG TPA: MdtA/MuxA family multidrug efflux RND transporter periplasmic adaptor subunit [Burkholderiales bacterium]|nr:MdtA/MuxA family multidrug efflux RND transporter periplasmic adaptor subunit [Burkholderiales bacterium]